MKRFSPFIVLIIFCLMAAIGSNRSQSQSESKLFPVLKDGRWGYIDSSGKLVIEPKFSMAEDFSEGLAAVMIGTIGRGYIDKSGQLVIQLDAGRVVLHRRFSEGLAPVRYSDGRTRYIDKTGQVSLETQFSEAYAFSEGLARVKDDGKYGFIDRTGKLVTDLIFDSAEDFSGGIAKVIVGTRIGYIDHTGHYVWKPTK
jgi:hypothetical protein